MSLSRRGGCRRGAFAARDDAAAGPSARRSAEPTGCGERRLVELLVRRRQVDEVVLALSLRSRLFGSHGRRVLPGPDLPDLPERHVPAPFGPAPSRASPRRLKRGPSEVASSGLVLHRVRIATPAAARGTSGGRAREYERAFDSDHPRGFRRALDGGDVGEVADAPKLSSISPLSARTRTLTGILA